MLLPCSAVIFDLDGTLINSLDDLADSVNAALAAFGLPTHPVELYRCFVGDGMVALVRRAVPEGTDETLVTRMLQKVREEYGRHWARKTRPYAGLDELLDGLRAKGIPLFVLTNKPHDFALETVAHFFPGIPFVRIQGSLPDCVAKPDPAVALDMARSLSLAPETVFFLGDSSVDMDTAVHAGMVPVGALWGFRREEELHRHGARLLLSRPQELLSHIR